MMANTDPRKRSAGSDYASLLGLGLSFIIILGVLAAVGFFVDKLLGTLPLFLLVGLGIGFTVWLFHLYRALDKLGKR